MAQFTFTFEPSAIVEKEVTPISPVYSPKQAGIPDMVLDHGVREFVVAEGKYVYYDGVAAHKDSQATIVYKSARIPLYGRNGAYVTIAKGAPFTVTATDAAEVAFYTAIVNALAESKFVKAVIG